METPNKVQYPGESSILGFNSVDSSPLSILKPLKLDEKQPWTNSSKFSFIHFKTATHVLIRHKIKGL